ncbi:MAG: M1 family metallopeptidase [Bacillota bacterium]
MKKVIAVILIGVLVLVGCTGKQEEIKTQETLIVDDYNQIDIHKINNYDIDVQFDPKKAKLEVRQRVDYINQEAVPLDAVYFHLYPNAFKKEESAPFLFDDFQNAYPEGFVPGFIEVTSIMVNDQDSRSELMGKGETIMKIVLPQVLQPGQRVNIEMRYFVQLPPAQERFGYGESTFNFGNWYPVAAVYDESGWNLDPYYPIGDPFYSDTSNYHITIEAPKEFIIAASGNILENTEKDKNRIWEIEAKLMRDFAWVASEDFEVEEREVEGTILKMYYIKDWSLRNDIKEFAADAAENSLKIFNKAFGKYPYGQYSVVQTNFPSGMEYPGIVFIGKQYYAKNEKEYLETVIVHETGHQWWYGVVGNDEIDEAWLDEGLTAYSEVVYAMEKYGEEEGQTYHQYENEDMYREMEQNLKDVIVLKSLDQFDNWYDYGPLVYSKGAVFVNQLYKKYGKETLYDIFSAYYDAYRFKIATTNDFQNICEQVTGDDLDSLFNEWLLAQ